MKKESIKELLIREQEKGNVVLTTPDRLVTISLKELVAQPTEGLLYDLNRLPEVALTFIDDPKWINDYAVAMVIFELKRQIDDYKKNNIK